MADLSILEKVLTVLGGLGIATYLGTRYNANKVAEPAMAMAKVEDRKANLQEIQLILERHEHEIQRLQEELEESKAALKAAKSLLRLALQHIGLLRRDMRAAAIEPPTLPIKLSSDELPWDLNMFD